MAVRVRYSMKVQISSTTAEDKDLGNLSFEQVSDDMGEGGARKFTLAGSAVDVPLSLGNVASAKLVLIRTVSKDPTVALPEVKVRLNLITGEQISLLPVGSHAKEAHLLLTSAGVTALFASNIGTTDVELTLAVAGD